MEKNIIRNQIQDILLNLTDIVEESNISEDTRERLQEIQDRLWLLQYSIK